MDPAIDRVFDRLAGFEVVLNQAMPNPNVTNAEPIIIGSIEDAYLFRSDGQSTILRLNERYTLEVGFFLFTHDGRTSIVATSAPSPLVTLKQAAS